MHSSGSYSFTVDRGDDSQSTITSHDQADITHTYAAAGEYTVKIKGTIEGFGFWRGTGTAVVGDSAKLLDVRSWGPVKLHSHGGQFMHAKNLRVFSATSVLDVGNVTDMSNMFANASAFNQDISGWNVGTVTNMDRMFYNASVFNQNISGWDVDQVTSFSNIFTGATKMNDNTGNMPPKFRP